MAQPTTVGKLLINNALPEDLRDDARTLDSKSIRALFTQIQQKYPEKYAEINRALNKVSSDFVSTYGGSASISLDDLRLDDQTRAKRVEVQRQIQAIQDGPGDAKTKNEQIIKILGANMDELSRSVYDEGVKRNNAFAHQILSGARGNKSQLLSLSVGDLMVMDHKNRPVPIPLLNSYSEGLDPAQYFAAAEGARRGAISVKFCLAEGTNVVMSDFSLKPIEQVKPGDIVLGANTDGITFPTKVVDAVYNGEQVCSTYEFKYYHIRSAKITCTADHEILAMLKLGKKEHSHASRSNYTPKKLRFSQARRDFHAVMPKGHFNPNMISERRALLLGLLLGDGCFSSKNHLLLSCGHPNMIEELQEYFSSLNLVARHLKNSGCTYHLSEIKRSTFRWNPITTGCLTGNPIKIWINDLRLWGCKSHTKYIPRHAWTWDNKSVADLLGGIYSTDGSFSINANGTIMITLSSVSKQLLKDVRELLETRFGIYPASTVINHRAWSPIRMKGLKDGYVSKHDLWSMGISLTDSVKRFHECIPLYGKKKLDFDRVLVQHKTIGRVCESTLPFKRRVDAGTLPTYDLHVDNPDHLFVVEGGLIVGNSTPKAGFLGKQLFQASHRLVVTEDDCKTSNGIAVKGEDPDNEGAVLIRPAGGFAVGTVLTPKHLKALSGQNILIRSAITCQAANGVCRYCAGKRERGDFPPIGENVGATSAQAISEPMSQAMLSEKHTGGTAAGATKASKGGLDLVNQLVQVPTTFPDAATLSGVDGSVEKVEDAPQGGKFVYVNSQRHWVSPKASLKVKVGDRLEEGDMISDGIVNPAEIVQYKGIGEGRRMFMEQLRDTMTGLGVPVHRRNIETLARGLINHVRITDIDGPEDTVPDDIVEYDRITRGYQPRYGAQKVAPKRGLGLYLEEPRLQYSIGTRITPKVADALESNGVAEVAAHKDKPSFQPEMVRAMETLSHTDDWMVRLGGFHLKKSLLRAAQRGSESKEHSTSFMPALAKGVGFGTEKGLY